MAAHLVEDTRMRIRTATASDLPIIVSLCREVQSRHADAFPQIFRADPSDEEMTAAFREELEAPSSYWIVAEEDEVVGYLNADFREIAENWCRNAHRMCSLGGIVVAAKNRRQGIARALFAELKREAVERETAQICLDVWAFNEEAQEAFARSGFRPLMHRMIAEVDSKS